MPEPRAVVDLTGRQPAWSAHARRLWERCAVAAVREDDAWATPPGRGHPSLCTALATTLGCDPDDLLITSGVRAAVALLARHLGRVIVELPTFAGVPVLLQHYGAAVELAPWTAMTRAPRGGLPAGRWFTSPARNPDGMTLCPSLIEQFASLAASGALVVQNEIYRWFARDVTWVPGAIVVGSLSKLAGGGARLGWVCHAGLADRVFPDQYAIMPPMAWQATWARFIAEGGLRVLLAEQVVPTLAARAAFAAAITTSLPDLPIDGEGPSLVIPLPAGVSEDAATRQLERAGVLVGRGGDFHLPEPGLRLCFTHLSAAEATIAAERLVEVAATWN